MYSPGSTKEPRANILIQTTAFLSLRGTAHSRSRTTVSLPSMPFCTAAAVPVVAVSDRGSGFSSRSVSVGVSAGFAYCSAAKLRLEAGRLVSVLHGCNEAMEVGPVPAFIFFLLLL